MRDQEGQDLNLMISVTTVGRRVIGHPIAELLVVAQETVVVDTMTETEEEVIEDTTDEVAPPAAEAPNPTVVEDPTTAVVETAAIAVMEEMDPSDRKNSEKVFASTVEKEAT